VDEIIAQLCQACDGMTVDQIEQAISGSAVASSIPDPRTLAAYIAACCAGAA